jgi:hypothetical protein
VGRRFCRLILAARRRPRAGQRLPDPGGDGPRPGGVRPGLRAPGPVPARINRFRVHEPEAASAEGYRLLWYQSARKAELDALARHTRVEGALAALAELQVCLLVLSLQALQRPVGSRFSGHSTLASRLTQ